MQTDMLADNVDDERRSITTIFWLVLAFAFAVMMVSIGAAWAFLTWMNILSSGELWPAFLVLGIGVLGALISLASIIAWLVREARR
ncbi:MAG: hypothetical protein P8189_04000 [Anaerolineae bacterium]|jgi:TRAP-type C4-dicarboxylate transport system permease small subunit